MWLRRYDFRGRLKRELLKHVRYSLAEYKELHKGELGAFRDRTRESICTHLLRLGINTKMVMRGRAKENIGFSVYRWDYSLGLIDIPDGSHPLGQHNPLRKERMHNTLLYWLWSTRPRLETKFPKLQIKSVYKKSFPLVDTVADLEWKGKDSGLGIISRLNGDILLKQPIMRSRGVKISNIFRVGKQRCLGVKKSVLLVNLSVG